MNSILSLLGLAQRAGKLVSGEDAVEAAIRRDKVHLLIIAADASGNTQTKFENMAKYRDIDFAVWGEKEQLGMAIGKARRAIIGVTDRGFAKAIHSRLAVEEKN
ncbi:MAG: 50S ribosomal protein L7ae [Firmicutes bacterium]|nr:50S ribosomal protein L7ae [Bacillota bacterium]